MSHRVDGFIPINTAQIIEDHAEFIETWVREDAVSTLSVSLDQLSAGSEIIAVDEFLNDAASLALDSVAFNATGRAKPRTVDAIPAARGLFAFMKDLTLLDAPAPALPSHGQIAKRLSYQPDDKSIHTLVGDHRDIGGSHSTIYNRRVTGEHLYIVGDTITPMTENQLVVIHGRHEFSVERGAWTTALHSVVADLDNSTVPLEWFARERYLASAKLGQQQTLQ